MTDKVVIVTGASRGIGRATVLAASAAGARVFAVARDLEALNTVCEQARAGAGHCQPIVADLTHYDEVEQLVARVWAEHGRLDVLINNAGLAPLAPMADYDIATFDAQVDINIRGVFYAIRTVWPLMISQGGGCVVNLSSLAAVDPFPGFQAYGASKAWVGAITQSLAAEGREHGVRVYAVAPAAVNTDMLRQHFPDFPPEQCLEPEDVAGAILMLLEDRAMHASGSIIYLRR